MDEYIKHEYIINEINQTLNKIGLNIDNIEIAGSNSNIDNIEIDLEDSNKWYKYLFENYDYIYELKPIFNRIKKTDLFIQDQDFYGYTIKQFVLEQIEESFNDPLYCKDFYAGLYIDNELSDLNNSLLDYILERVEKCYNEYNYYI